jgi:hypothetical protein
MRLLDQDRILIDYPHMFEEGHDVPDWQIHTTLLDGRYEFHEDMDDRYLAKYARKREGVVITVIFEVQEFAWGRRIFVLTAFGPRRQR